MLTQNINQVVETRDILRHPRSQNIHFSSTLSETGTGAHAPLKQKNESRKRKASDTQLLEILQMRGDREATG